MSSDLRLADWTSPFEAGLDGDALEDLGRQLRQLVDKHGLPGFALALIKDGRTAFSERYGMRDLERRRPVTDSTVFRQYSMTKAVVAVALMTFYEEGRVGLDDDISKYLGDNWLPQHLKVAASDGVVRGAPGEIPEHSAIGTGDTVFFRGRQLRNHVDIDPAGTARCRWDDCGAWQAFTIELLPAKASADANAAARVALRGHTKQFLDVVDGSVAASSTDPVAWLLDMDSPLLGSATLLAGAELRLRHEDTGVWVKISDAGAGQSTYLRCECTSGESSATPFVLEKQTWLVPKSTAATRAITIRHLMTHTSGLDYSGVDAVPVTALDSVARRLVEKCERGEVTCLADWVSELSRFPLRHQPGERFQYGFSLDVLGRIVEVLASAPLDIVLRERVLAPLAMHATGFSVASADAEDKLASLYKVLSEGTPPELADDPVSGKSAWVPPKGPAPIFGGGGGVETSRGGLVSSLPDYVRFCEMLRGQGELDGVRLLRSDTVALMTRTNHLGVVLGDPRATMGGVDRRAWNLLGCLQLPDSPEQPGAYGWGGWASTLWRVYPHHGVSLVFMTNCIGADNKTEEIILRHVGQALTRPSPKQRWLAPHATTLAAALVGSVLVATVVAPRVRAFALQSNR